MSFADENEFNAFVYRDAYLPHVTAESTKEALGHFLLRLKGDRDWEWLAMAVRRSLAMTMRNVSDGPERQSNADTRKEIQALAKRTGKLWAALFEGRSAEAEDAVWAYSWWHWDGKGGEEIAPHLASGTPDGWNRFNEAVSQLDWLSGYLHQVARNIPSQAPKWTKAEWREIRIQRGQCLAPVYLAAFGANELAHKAFGDFYQRMIALAFPREPDDLPDFEAVITEVRQRHLATPVQFTAEHIPGL
ncbi:hypothetical protein SAMN06297468_1164 [Altererythrobacter xiamenensis]|uniref:Uncharacterized protein n=1 Tax=Altererythrobacter xiamenensis TaxID=1316679 RepID=A0A1Y6F863_9SPHN|nr:hypothetical protein [Altererythrobacter xiamenensis]SMQ68892.1 hypothetical protein SAMN06297468_1164 [Altererythrobacter xiamenensis]